MKLSEHFSEEEFITKSQPTGIEIGHLRLLCNYLLEPIRNAWGSGIRITSGYRSPEHNAAVGGSKTSAHCLGYAADIIPSNGKIKEFKQCVKVELLNSGIPFDQCIDERNTKGSEWIHLGLMNANGEQRGQFLKTTDGKTYQQDRI